MDPVKEFINDLKSPDPSIRFSVLSRIEDLAWNEQQQNTLKSLIEQETDPGLKFQMQKVLARSDGTAKGSVAEIEQLLNDPERDEMALALMLESVKRADAPLVIMSLRAAGWSSFSQQLLPSVLKFLKKFGSFEDAAEIEMLCRHHDPRVLASAIEALEKIAPDRLKDLIVPLLVNPNFGIRSRAVRLLYRWDPNEALRHFEAMLFSPAESEKQAALFHAFFFPFDQIESLMLRFISVEKDTDLVKKAGLLFMANPNKQSPARLLEARQASSGEKFQLIDNILKGVLTSLYQAKMVNATPEKMLEVLENHFKQKRLKLFIERYSLGLQSGDVETRLKSAVKLCDLVRYGVAEARALIEKFLNTERNAELRDRVKKYFAACLPGKEQKISKTIDELKPEQRKELFKAINKENFAPIKEFGQKNFKNLELEEKVVLIKAIEQFGSSADAQIPALALKSDNPELLAAAIDCLSAIDPDSLSPFLPQFIKHSFAEVREAAIKVFALFDKEQAIALVEKMLFSVQPLQRKQAISCCAHFDFQAVRHLLLRALKIEADPENQLQICSLLRSNADEELFYKLYADFKSCKTTKASVYEDLCKQIADALSSASTPISKQKLYEVAIRKLEEEEKIKSQRQAYKLEKIQAIRDSSSKKVEIDAGLIRFTVVAYAIGAVLTALIWFLFMAPSTREKLVYSKKPVVARFVTRTIIVKGKILSQNAGQRTVVLQNTLDDKKKYRIKISENKGKLPKVGSTYHAQIKTTAGGEEISATLLSAF